MTCLQLHPPFECIVPELRKVVEDVVVLSNGHSSVLARRRSRGHSTIDKSAPTISLSAMDIDSFEFTRELHTRTYMPPIHVCSLLV